MNMTALFVELLVIGIGAASWLALLIAGILNWRLDVGALHEPTTFIAGVTALAYVLGIIVDRLARGLFMRDWIDIPVRKAEVNLARYFMLQETAAVDSREYAPCSVFTLASATVREQTDMPAHTAYALLQFMFNGGVLPMRLLFDAVQRNRSEQGVTRPRAAIIKMVLLSQNPESQPGDEMVELDTRQHHPAYLFRTPPLPTRQTATSGDR